MSTMPAGSPMKHDSDDKLVRTLEENVYSVDGAKEPSTSADDSAVAGREKRTATAARGGRRKRRSTFIWPTKTR